METFEAKSDMDECLPDELLIEESAVLLVRDYFLVEIAIVKKLHDDAG
jgi:hypothetical protein